MPHAGDLVAEMLVRYGIDCVFGQPGGQTAALYDGIARRAPKINHVLIRDERSAGYAADAYARLTGRPGIVDVTVGPGTTKLPDGLLESYNASIPIVAIVGELPMDWEPLREGGVASQGFDQVPFLKSMTKQTWIVPSVQAMPSIIRAAFRVATTGRPGPVAIVIPHDILDAEWNEEEVDASVDERFSFAPAFRPRPSEEDLREAAELLGRAERPAIIAGGAVHGSGGADAVRELAERTGALVVTSFSGKGVVDETKAYAGGVLNPLGSPAATELVRRADLLLWAGCKVGQNTSLNWAVPSGEQVTIQIDIEPSQLGRTFRPTVALQGDAKATLEGILEHADAAEHDEWADEIAEAKGRWEEQRAERQASGVSPVDPPRAVAEILERLGPDDVVISDASFSAGWIASYMPTPWVGRNWLFARGLGGLGYSLPAAVGAAVARPKGRIVTISGDGGFSYSIGEIATLAQYGMNVVNIVLNNGKLGWLQMWQHLHYEGLRQSVDLERPGHPPDFAGAGAALGGAGFKADTAEELADALDGAFAASGPVVVDIRIDADATPIPSYVKRLESGKHFPRPGTVYQLREWTQSPDDISIETQVPQ
jgi:acetolactate synthase I/II/III large subunit